MSDGMMSRSSKVVSIEIGVSGESGERWEMFPDPIEQRALRGMSAADLAIALWEGSGEFVFGTAIQEIARNVSVDKAMDVVNEALREYPRQRGEILETLESIRAVTAEWSEYDDRAGSYGYDPVHIARHRELVDRLARLLEPGRPA